jgi:transmembrane sensor
MKKNDENPTVTAQVSEKKSKEISDQASLWLLTITEDNSEINQQALQNWLSLSAQHRQTYAQYENMWQVAEELPLDLFNEELAELTLSVSEPELLVASPAPTAVANHQISFVAHLISLFTLRRTMYTASFASAVFAVLLTISNTDQVLSPPVVTISGEKKNVLRVNEYQTELGQHQEIKAKDGSIIVLAAKSRVFIDYSTKQRDVYLLSGEAIFTVAKDKERPFVVHNNGRMVQAIGTIFNVRESKTAMQVTVLEGIVQVTTPLLNDVQVQSTEIGIARLGESVKLVAGQALQLDDLGKFSATYAVESNDRMAWQKGRLNYVNTELGNVVFDLKRYSNLSINIPDKQVANMGYTGSVIYDKVDDWLIALPYIFPVEVLRHGDTVVIKKRHVN